MGTDYVKCYGDLQNELDEAKTTLLTLNDNIRRIIGRSHKDQRNERLNPSHASNRNETRVGRVQTRRVLSNPLGRKMYNFLTTGHQMPSNAIGKSVFMRLSAPSSDTVDDEPKPRVSSRIIRELPTRQEIVAAQGIDSESRARNRRMFGSLVGTLHKFCQEESRLKQKEDKKAQIEKKLEEQEILERETLKREREALFQDRKRKQLEIKRLELKMSRLKDFEIWQSSQKHFRCHIKTKTKPHLYYRPRIVSAMTEKLLLECQNSINLAIQTKRSNLSKEFHEMENFSTIQEFNVEEQIDISDNTNTVDDSYDIEGTGKISSPINDKLGIKNILKKEYLDSKENTLKEPMLNSSIIVVKT